MAKARRPKDQDTRTAAGAALVDLLFELFRIYARFNSIGDEVARKYGLSGARWRVLGSETNGGKSVSAIARERGLARQSVQQIVNSLVEDGLVSFKKNENHKSSKLVVLTPEGRTAIRRLNQKSAGWINHIAAITRVDEIKGTMETLRKIRERLEQTGAWPLEQDIDGPAGKRPAKTKGR
jgi:DNA-binding MarR family transcriptional regulator